MQVRVFPHPSKEWVYTVEVVNIQDEKAPVLIELIDQEGESIATQFVEVHKDSFSANLTFSQDVANDTFTVRVRVAEKQYEQRLVINYKKFRSKIFKACPLRERLFL